MRWMLAFLPFVAGVAAAAEISIDPLWRRETPRAIYPRPVIDGGRLYVGGEEGILRALNRENGEVVWRYRAGAPIASAAGFDDKRVYVLSRDGMVHGVDKEKGRAVWTFRTGGEKQWDYWDLFLSRPAVDGKHWLYFGSGDHHIYSLNRRTGALRWRTETGAIVHGDPVLSGEKVIVGGFDGRMYALDQADGAVLWRFKTVGNSYFRAGEIPGSPSVGDGVVYFGSRDYNLYAILAETGTGAWNERTPSWVVGKPLISGGGVYVATSDAPRVYAFDAASGAERWQTPLSLNVFGGAVAVGDDHVAVAGLDGRINLLAIASGAIVAWHDTEMAQRNRSALFDDEGKQRAVEIRSWEDLFGLYDRYFAELGGIAGGLAVEGGTLYYATGAGEIAAVRVRGIVPLASQAD